MPARPRQPGAVYRYDHTAAPDWLPLEQLARIAQDNPRLPYLDPDDFMYMGRAVHPTRPPILHYKHTLTRRYLCLDAGGHAYAPTPTPATDAESYTAIRDVRAAAARVLGGGAPTPAPTAEPPPLAL
jgi:hypothetical protein